MDRVKLASNEELVKRGNDIVRKIDRIVKLSEDGVSLVAVGIELSNGISKWFESRDYPEMVKAIQNVIAPVIAEEMKRLEQELAEL